jgi:hypothetical protein
MVLLVLPMVFAQDERVASKRPIHRLHVIGTGLSINAEDPMDFTHAKVVVGAVRIKKAVVSAEEETTEETVKFVVKRIGVLMLDKKRYHLRNVAVREGEISADIFDPKEVTATETEKTAIGQIYVKRYEKPGRDIWAGAMELNGESFNVYFLGVHRKFKPIEVAEKVGEYCRKHPENERCRVAAKIVKTACKEKPWLCKQRITEFCSKNPENEKCVALKKLYCLRNAADERCRDYLKRLCEKDPTQRFCRIKKVENEKVVTIEEKEVEPEEAEEGEVTEDIERPIVKVVTPMIKVIDRSSPKLA